MAKVNFRHNKRQRELARKERQSQRLSRRGELPPEEAVAAPVSPDQTSADSGTSATLPNTEQQS
jgi:hypothetical protein